RRAAEAAGDEYNAKLIAILEHQVASLRLLKAGDSGGAIEHAAQAADMEVQYMRVPSGPPMPITPANELYANILLETGNAADAVGAYQAALNWVPNRTPSMLGLARASTAIGDHETATDMYIRLREMPGANPKGPAVMAAHSASGDD
ncbi:MAG: hypothetical protein AAGA61_03370, partial [Pseudomonadota bacterium]